MTVPSPTEETQDQAGALRFVKVDDETWLNPDLIVAVTMEHSSNEQWSKVHVYHAGGSKYGAVLSWTFSLKADLAAGQVDSHPRRDAEDFAHKIVGLTR